MLFKFQKIIIQKIIIFNLVIIKMVFLPYYFILKKLKQNYFLPQENLKILKLYPKYSFIYQEQGHG